jgi:hypothetical protein
MRVIMPEAAGAGASGIVDSMAMPAGTTERRWRAFADVVAFSLGMNVWVSIVILPAVFVGELHGATRMLAALLPFAVLMLGLARRSEAILLGLFPAAVLVPVGLAPELATAQVYGPVRFTLVALGVVAYLFGVAFFTNFHEPSAPRSTRSLSSAQAGPPARWRRRERVYWTLTALSIVIPVVLIAWVNYDDAIAAFLGEMYPGRVALMTTALTIGAIVLWLAIYHHAFLGVLRPHRTGDRDLVGSLSRTLAEAKLGRPRKRFYTAVACALAAMLVLLLSRHL